MITTTATTIRARLAAVLLPLLFGAAVPGFAAGSDAPPAAPGVRPAGELILIAGAADLRQSDKAAFAGLQVRFASNLYGIHPFVSAGGVYGGTNYLGTGLLYGFNLARRLRFTFGSGPGYYHHKGRDTDLDYKIEFSSWAELSTLLYGHRVGLTFGHLSNAHLGHHNPGTETVGLTWSACTW